MISPHLVLEAMPAYLGLQVLSIFSIYTNERDRFNYLEMVQMHVHLHGSHGS